jgi:hypothetical protein
MTGRQWTSPALGNASNYVLTGLPTGFSTGQEYGWDVLVYTDQGLGSPYYYSTITFSATDASSAGGGKQDRNRPAGAKAPAPPDFAR